MYGAEETVGEQWTALVGVEEVVVVLSSGAVVALGTLSLSTEKVDVSKDNILREEALRSVCDETCGAIMPVAWIVDDTNRVTSKC